MFGMFMDTSIVHSIISNRDLVLINVFNQVCCWASGIYMLMVVGGQVI